MVLMAAYIPGLLWNAWRCQKESLYTMKMNINGSKLLDKTDSIKTIQENLIDIFSYLVYTMYILSAGRFLYAGTSKRMGK